MWRFLQVMHPVRTLRVLVRVVLVDAMEDDEAASSISEGDYYPFEAVRRGTCMIRPTWAQLTRSFAAHTDGGRRQDLVLFRGGDR